MNIKFIYIVFILVFTNSCTKPKKVQSSISESQEISVGFYKADQMMSKLIPLISILKEDQKLVSYAVFQDHCFLIKRHYFEVWNKKLPLHVKSIHGPGVKNYGANCSYVSDIIYDSPEKLKISISIQTESGEQKNTYILKKISREDFLHFVQQVQNEAVEFTTEESVCISNFGQPCEKLSLFTGIKL